MICRKCDEPKDDDQFPLVGLHRKRTCKLCLSIASAAKRNAPEPVPRVGNVLDRYRNTVRPALRAAG